MHYTNCHQFCKPTLSYKLPKNLDEIDLAFTISIKTVITNSNKKTHQSRWNKKTIMATVLIFLTNIHADITYIGMIFSVQDWEIWHWNLKPWDSHLYIFTELETDMVMVIEAIHATKSQY